MKLSLIILSLLIFTALVACVDRRHTRYTRRHKTHGVKVILCDAGSSKTKCMCYEDDLKVGADQTLENNLDSTPKVQEALGDYFAGTIDATKYTANVKGLVDGLTQCAGYASLWVLSTAGSRQKIWETANIDRDAKDTALNAALAVTFGTKRNYQVISGRFEGFFGMAHAYKTHSATIGNKAMVYYECGGSSCQLSFPSDASCATEFFDAVKGTYTRFKKTRRGAVRAAKRMLTRTGGVMLVDPIFGLALNDPSTGAKTKLRLFSNSWLGTGANKDAFQGFIDDEGTKLSDSCFLQAAPVAGLYDKCYNAILDVFASKVTKDLTLEQAMFPQSLGALKQYSCDSQKWANGQVLVIQSGALYGNIKAGLASHAYQGVGAQAAASTGKVPYLQTLTDIKNFAELNCAGKIDAADKFWKNGCLVLQHYHVFFKSVLGMSYDQQILVISDSDWIAAAYRYLESRGAGKDVALSTDIKWPFPKTNEMEDKAYP